MSAPQIPEAHGSLFAAEGKLGDLSRIATLNNPAEALGYVIDRITDLGRLVGNETQLGLPREPKPLRDWSAEAAEASSGYLSGITSYLGYGEGQDSVREAKKEACEQAAAAASYYDRLKSCYETFNTITAAFTKDIPYLKNAVKDQTIHHGQLQKMADDVLHEYDKLQKALKDELKANDPKLYAEFVKASGKDFENEREIFHKKIMEYLKKSKSDNVDLKQQLSVLQEQLRRAGQEIKHYKGERSNENLGRSKNGSLADSAELTTQDAQGRLTVAQGEIKHLQAMNMELKKEIASLASEKDRAIEDGCILSAERDSLAEVISQQAGQLRAQGNYASGYLQILSELKAERQQLEQAHTENRSRQQSFLSKNRQLQAQLDRYKSVYNQLDKEKNNAETTIQQLRDQAKAEALRVKHLEEKRTEQQEKLQSLERELKISKISESAKKSTGDKAGKDRFKGEGELTELKKSLETRQAELKKSKADNSTLQSELREKLDLLTQYEKEKDRFSEQMTQFGVAKSRLRKTQQELDSTQQQVRQLEKNLTEYAKQLSGLEDMRSKHKLMSSQLTSTRERESKLNSDLLNKKREVQSLQAELVQLKELQAQLPEKDVLQKKATEARTALNKAKQEKQQIVAEMMKLKNELTDAQLKVARSEGQYEKQSVTLAAVEMKQRDLTTEIEKRNAMIKRQAERLEETEKEFSSVKIRSEGLEKTLQQKQDRLNELEQVEQKRARLAQSIEAMKSELAQQKSDNGVLSSKLVRAEASLKAINFDVEALHTERSKLFAEVNGLNQEAADLRQAARSAEDLQKQLDTAKNELEQVQGELKTQTQEKRNIQKALLESEKKKDEALSLAKEMEKGLVKVQSELMTRESEQKAAYDQQQDMIEKLRRAEVTESELKENIARLKDQIHQQIEDNALLRTEIEELKPRAFETNPALASLPPVVNREAENAGLHQKIQQLEEEVKALEVENDELRITMMEPRDVHSAPDYSQLFSPEPGSINSMSFREEDSLRMAPEATLTSMPYNSMSSLPASSGPVSMINAGVETSQRGKARNVENKLLLQRIHVAESEKLKLEQDLKQSENKFVQLKQEKKAELNRLRAEKESMETRLQAFESDQDDIAYLQGNLQQEKQKVLRLEQELTDQKAALNQEICSIESQLHLAQKAKLDAELKFRHESEKEAELLATHRRNIDLSHQQQMLMKTQGAFVQALYDRLGADAESVLDELVQQYCGELQKKADEGELVSLRFEN